MAAQFSVDSMDYLADKWNRCPDLSDESLAYLTSQTSGLIVDLLQASESTGTLTLTRRISIRMPVKLFGNADEKE